MWDEWTILAYVVLIVLPVALCFDWHSRLSEDINYAPTYPIK
jgi:hypothetical protein